jgi:hypothetical protein
LNGRFAQSANGQMETHIYDMMGRERFSKEIMVDGGNFSLSLVNAQLKPGSYMFVGILNNSRYMKTVLVR